MDLNEAAQRILRRHWVLIVVMTVIGLSIPVALLRLQEDTYEATARIVIGAGDARDSNEATALADTALALATSEGVLGRALEQAGARRDPVIFVEQVQVEPVGTSGVLELSVTDTDARASAAIVNAIAAEVVRMRDDGFYASTRQALADTDAEIATLSQRIAEVEAAADSTVARFGRVDALALRHAQAVGERANLQGQRQQLVQALAGAVRPQVVDASATAGILVPSEAPSRLAVGGILGLVLGVALAATKESLRPTLNAAAIARHLGAPLLGRLPRRPRGDTGVSDPWLANYLKLAADDAGVRSVQLVPVGPWVDVSGLARDLDDEEGGLRVTPLALDAEATRDQVRQREAVGPGAGIVAVVPAVVKGTAVFEHVERHTELTRQPVIGVITYREKGRRRPTSGTTAPKRPVAETGATVETDADRRPTVAPAS
ncbi:hypothetical protein [Geodermatophilus ruber]|uniref:Chain length determinant protein n=1 Tax=Geodermatophilus ruber TaxID=504800 RepID=A0A1I4G6A6_9ACTN|nr:hypothetical protein [Geodermatophilus ruber]SFL25618.1 Chain length determinant protein [Geodermatophilus ruber]